MKKCKECGEIKPLNRFSKYNGKEGSTTKDGYQSTCIDCVTKKFVGSNSNRANNVEKELEHQKMLDEREAKKREMQVKLARMEDYSEEFQKKVQELRKKVIVRRDLLKGSK